MDPRQAVRLALKKRMAAEPPPSESEAQAIGELAVAEYCIFCMALDTYMRYVEEATGTEDPDDPVIRKGLKVLRIADAELDSIKAFLDRELPSDTHKRMLDRAFRLRARTPAQAAKRALMLRTLLSRGGAKTMRAVFETNRALREIRAAIAASMMDDADAALDLFAALPIKNARLRAWMDLAAKTAGSGDLPQNPVEVGTQVAVDKAEELMTQAVQSAGAVTADEVKSTQETQTAQLIEVEEQSAEAARKALEAAAEPDIPLTKSEVIGVATAAAVATAADPSKPQNVPEPLRRLDDEQRAAALTDGRVLVAAGAGAGKSTTLVARVNYLLKDRRVNPSRILVTSFNTKAANELKEKIGKSAGGDALKAMSVGTMHSLFRRFIGEYGTTEEKAAMGLDKGGATGFIGRGSKVARTIQRMWKECFDEDERPTPRMKSMLLYKSQWSGNNVSPADAKELATTQEERDAADWYEMYEGLKGGLGAYEPPCEERSREVAEDEYQEKLDKWRRRGGRGRPPKRRGTTYETFQAKNRPGGVRLGDFDDMLGIFHDVLEREPGVRKAIQKMYDHITVDECVHEDTEVLTESGEYKCVGEVEPGERVLSFENGSAVYKRVLDKKQSGRTEGVTIRTASGCTLTMTLNHRLYATQFDPTEQLEEGLLALYLMYRRDLGFRIGTSTVPYLLERGKTSHRAGAERADRMWILEVGDESEILFKELDYSLEHRVPARLFEAEIRGCDQERSDKIFAKYGENGRALLDEYGLDFNYPHWANSSYTGGRNDRLVVAVKAHRLGGYRGQRSNGRGTMVNLQWTGDDLGLTKIAPVYEIHGGRRKAIHRQSSSYAKAREDAVRIANHLGALVVEDIEIQSTRCVLTTAGALRVGMQVPVWLSGQARDVNPILRGSEIRSIADKYRVEVSARGCVPMAAYEEIRRRQLEAADPNPLPAPDDTKMELDEIVEILPFVDGTFYDLAIEDSANFFGNGVLSHNCQDLNEVQHGIISMMSEHVKDDSEGKSVWMVGDDKQSIYTFRGARPDLFTGLHDEEGWATRMIRTNYRSEPEIVEAGNTLIAHNDGQIPMAANPSPGKRRGAASIRVETPEDEAEAALGVIEEIKREGAARPEGEESTFYAENAILTRTNKELHAFETACIIRGIPYARKGSSSFLGSPETKAMLGYVQLVTGGPDQYEQMQKALGETINRPNRFFVGPDAAMTAVMDSLKDFARASRTPLKDTNPMEALSDYEFVNNLASKLARTRSGFKFDKTVEAIQELRYSLAEMQANTSEPGYQTTDLFDEILALKGKTSAVDPATGRNVWIEQSFRETLQVELRDAPGDDDDKANEEDEDEADPTKGLGNITFLYKLMEVDPTDPMDLEKSPDSPMGFAAKMDRYAKKADDLRIDLNKWDKRQAALPPEQRSAPPAVYLGTAHSVKGAEWNNTYVSMPAGKFPFEPPVKPGEPPPPPEKVKADLETERRLAYVAMTRAAKKLTVVCPAQVGGKPAGVSRFVGEAGLKPGENVEKPEGEAGGLPEPEPGAGETVGPIKTADLWDPAPESMPSPWDPSEFGEDA